MRVRRRGWTMPREDIPSMLGMIEAKIASSKIEFQHRNALIRLRATLEEDLDDQTGDPAPLISPVTVEPGSATISPDSARPAFQRNDASCP
jgi:hypothetical protein